MPNVYIIRTEHEGEPIAGIVEEISKGRACIGWSWLDKLDLRKMTKKLDAGKRLDKEQQWAKRCLGFLWWIEEGDILIYPNQPERRKFTVCRVTGEYDYSPEGILDDDFRSFRPCELIFAGVPYEHDTVSSAFRNRLGRPGRISTYYDTDTFFHFLDEYKESDSNKKKERNEINIIHRELSRNVPALIVREYSRHDFSRKFCIALFESMGYSCKALEGRSDAGTDVLVEISDPLMGENLEPVRVGVQCFAYVGDVSTQEIRRKLKQLLDGWEINGLERGALFTTGYCDDKARAVVSQHNKEHSDKPVALIDAAQVTDLFLEHFSPGGNS